ncbi:putative Cyc2-like cyclin [Leptomonas pyrrhocoris]|uniref:Putative Cyc2-like cyclin n=1 Tax=Leptomonas pyrrhocoris TaxID=157538 RepID=A0A0N1J4V7_LEPPY|nr:putative Cyc2-like cyclin [Leptomonas pyrrhocoris]KPA80852.1 putative Cyc2-like cyclin [Leptomonas pyrrhocoris]|eukprot:XP_015659291.1 putative Cyc2-like cyclin [Leptomonas pyrrhocoris]
MHIPDPTTFADYSSTRLDTSMTTSTSVSPMPSAANGGAATRVVVHDAVDYDGEMDKAVSKAQQRERGDDDDDAEREEEGNRKQRQHQPQQRLPPPQQQQKQPRRDDDDSATQATTTATMIKVVPTMVAGSNNTHAVAPDATPQEPPPKRFATGGEDVVAELGYAVLHRGDGVDDDDNTNEEAEGKSTAMRPASVRRRHRRTAASTVEEDGDNGGIGVGGGEDEGDWMSESGSSNSRPSVRQSSTVPRRAAHAHQQQQPDKSDKESRRRSRLARHGSLLGGGRYSNDSVTASISYDPSRFNTPPLAQRQQQQQQKSEESPFTQSTSSVGLKPELGGHPSASQPSCATPPEAQAHSKAAAPPPQQQQQQQQQQQVFLPPPAQPGIPLIETRYAFLALSFMMRMLCKLHKGEPIPSSDFHSHCIPPMSVTMYVERLVRYCTGSGEALLCAFLLLLKYVFHSGHPITIYNAHRLLITSVVLGIKLRDDVYYSNIYYARIGGISGREMNKLEVLFLSKLDWETQVHAAEYAALLALLAELAVDVDPTPAQLTAFAAAFPEKVAAYVPDEDDAEVDEAAEKLRQVSTSTAATSPSSTRATAEGTSSAVTPEPVLLDATQRKTLRGAYRLHQWHTLVEPWMAQLNEHVFARKQENAQAATAAWQEEDARWRQYYRDDEAAASRLKREDSPGAWLSPLSVQRRVTSASTLATAHKNNVGSDRSRAAAAWNDEPPYQSSWPLAEGIPHHGGNGHSSYAAQQQQQQQQQELNPRYNNFINFANAVTGGYFDAPVASGSGGMHRHASPASISQQQQPSSSVYSYGLGASRRVSSAPMAAAGSHAVRYHTAAERAPRPTSATFDITNRAAASTTGAEMDSTASNTHTSNGSASEGNSRHSNTSVAALVPSQLQQLQQPSVSGTTTATTARAASPVSSTTPGSGINVNAQPYYYVSSRMRKQQQRQQQTSASAPVSTAAALSPPSTDASPDRPRNNLMVTDTTSSSSGAARATVPNVSSPTEVSSLCSSGSSFTSPACVNPPPHHNNYSSSNSSGMEAVLAAMKRGSTAVLYTADNEKVVSHADPGEGTRHNNSSGSTTGASLTFPARPIARGMLGGGHEGEQAAAAATAAAAHVPRRSPQTAYPAQVHRRPAYTAQHSLGKKRSKPDSYKDY